MLRLYINREAAKVAARRPNWLMAMFGKQPSVKFGVRGEGEFFCSPYPGAQWPVDAGGRPFTTTPSRCEAQEIGDDLKRRGLLGEVTEFVEIPASLIPKEARDFRDESTGATQPHFVTARPIELGEGVVLELGIGSDALCFDESRLVKMMARAPDCETLDRVLGQHGIWSILHGPIQVVSSPDMQNEDITIAEPGVPADDKV